MRSGSLPNPPSVRGPAMSPASSVAGLIRVSPASAAKTETIWRDVSFVSGLTIAAAKVGSPGGAPTGAGRAGSAPPHAPRVTASSPTRWKGCRFMAGSYVTLHCGARTTGTARFQAAREKVDRRASPSAPRTGALSCGAMKRKPSPEATPAGPLRTSREVYDQIEWDARLDAGAFVVDYEERLSGKMRAMAFPDFVPGGDIPWHRVWSFRIGERVVWDRKTRTDLLLGAAGMPDAPAPSAPPALVSATPAGSNALLRRPLTAYRFDPAQEAWVPVTAASPPPARPGVTLTVVTYNVLTDAHERELIDTARRTPAALEALRAEDADVLALVEVTPAFLRALGEAAWVRDGYVLSDAPVGGETVTPLGQLLLSRLGFAELSVFAFSPRKRAVAARIEAGGLSLAVSAVHLTSDRSPDAASSRERQVRLLLEHGAPRAGVPWLLVGDFNVADDALNPALRAGGLTDLWTELRPGVPGFTFDPLRNVLANLMSRKGRPARLDRMYLRPGGELRADAIDLVAEDPIAGHPDGLHPSDHFGLRCRLSSPSLAQLAPTPVLHPPTYRSALVVVPPGSVHGPIQALRAKHDPSYPRWMPHVTLVYGFVDEEHFEEAARAVALALASTPPFEVQLDSFDVFEHDGSATVWLRPKSRPEGALRSLQAALQAIFPRCDEQAGKSSAGFTPHLTVARFPRARAGERNPPGRGVAAQCPRAGVHGGSGPSDQPPRRRALRPPRLGVPRRGPRRLVRRGARAQAAAPGSSRCSTWTARPSTEPASRPRSHRSRPCCRRSAGSDAEVFPIGSYRLGIAEADSDLDIVVVGRVGRARFVAGLSDELTRTPGVSGVRAVASATSSAVRFVASGVHVDVAFARWPDEVLPAAPEALSLADLERFDTDSVRALTGCRDAVALLGDIVATGGTAEFLAVALAVKRWARARQINAQAFGYPGGLAWAVLAARACVAAESGEDAEAIVERLFEDLSTHAFPRPIALSDAAARGFAPGPRDVMTVVTPSAPYRNAARSATPATRAVVLAEARRALNWVRSARERRGRRGPSCSSRSIRSAATSIASSRSSSRPMTRPSWAGSRATCSGWCSRWSGYLHRRASAPSRARWRAPAEARRSRLASVRVSRRKPPRRRSPQRSPAGRTGRAARRCAAGSPTRTA